MKALVLQTHGGSDSLSVVELLEPKLDSTTSILIKVGFCALSITDLEIREGFDSKLIRPKLYEDTIKNPYIPGFEISGTIIQTGSEVDRFQVGEEVLAMIPADIGGGCGEFLVIPHYYAVKLPKPVAPEVACSAIGPSMRVLRAFRRTLRPEPGESIMILDPTSEMGLIAIQFAIHLQLQVLVVFLNDDKDDSRIMEQYKWLREKYGDQIAFIKSDAAGDRLRNGATSPRRTLFDGVMERAPQGIDCILETVPSTLVLPSMKDPLSMGPERHRIDIAELVDCLAFGGRWATLDRNLQLDPPNSQVLYLRNSIIGFVSDQGPLLSGDRITEQIANMNQILSYLVPPEHLSNIDLLDDTVVSPLTPAALPATTPQKSIGSFPRLDIPQPVIYPLDQSAKAHDAVWKTRFGNLPHHGRILIKIANV